MILEHEILFNKYGQDIIESNVLMETFLDSGEAVQTEFFEYLLFLIIQSKVFTQDIEEAIKNSNLKPTFTPCVLLKKGVE
ncbi:DUF5958 family protein, partial [Elizabethkingia meningoseptica]